MYEDQIVIMDEGSSIQCEVKVIEIINSRLCIVEDADGDLWEVERQRLSPLNPEI